MQELWRSIAKRFSEIVCLRGGKLAISGRGACAVVEVVATSLEDAENRAKALAIAARDAGVLLHLTGPHRNRLVFIPAPDHGSVLGRIDPAKIGSCMGRDSWE